jgi:hypothetical protein
MLTLEVDISMFLHTYNGLVDWSSELCAVPHVEHLNFPSIKFKTLRNMGLVLIHHSYKPIVTCGISVLLGLGYAVGLIIRYLRSCIIRCSIN